MKQKEMCLKLTKAMNRLLDVKEQDKAEFIWDVIKFIESLPATLFQPVVNQADAPHGDAFEEVGIFKKKLYSFIHDNHYAKECIIEEDHRDIIDCRSVIHFIENWAG